MQQTIFPSRQNRSAYRKGYKNLDDIFLYYEKQVEKPVPSKIFKAVVIELFQFILNKALSGDIVPLIPSFGYMLVAGKKQKVRVEDDQIKGLSPNWNKTYQLWDKDAKAKEEKRIIYNTNEETSNVRFRFMWTSGALNSLNNMIANKAYYTFRLCATERRRLANLIKSGSEYMVIKKRLNTTAINNMTNDFQ